MPEVSCPVKACRMYLVRASSLRMPPSSLTNLKLTVRATTRPSRIDSDPRTSISNQVSLRGYQKTVVDTLGSGRWRVVSLSPQIHAWANVDSASLIQGNRTEMETRKMVLKGDDTKFITFHLFWVYGMTSVQRSDHHLPVGPK